MPQLTSTGLIRILGHVTLIMVVPMLGGAVAGLLADSALGTSPLFVLSGFAAGNLIAATGIWLYIRTHRPDVPGGGAGTEARNEGAASASLGEVEPRSGERADDR